MFSYLKKKFDKLTQKGAFKEFGFSINDFQIEGVGTVQYAQWKHPFESIKTITSSQILFYKKLVNNGGFIIDIGAHTGDTTIPMALAVGANGLVLGVEPNRYVFKILTENAKLNPELTNIVPLPFAATDKDGDFTFYYSDASFCNGGNLSEIKNKKHHHKYPLLVSGKNMEDYLYKNYLNDLNRLQLLKVDAEGYDKEILKTFSRLLSEYKPNIMMECYKYLNQEERNDLYDTVAKHGYILYHLESFEADGKWEKIERKDMMLRPHFEILAVHESSLLNR
jgi:FkbM family methyltransferase